MYRVLVIEERHAIADLLVARLRESPVVQFCQRMRLRKADSGSLRVRAVADELDHHSIDTVVYSPSRCPRLLVAPDIVEAEAILRQSAKSNLKRFVLLSSAQIYGASSHNQGLIPESRLPVCLNRSQLAREWIALEAIVARHLHNCVTKLTMLRPAAVLIAGGSDYFSR